MVNVGEGCLGVSASLQHGRGAPKGKLRPHIQNLREMMLIGKIAGVQLTPFHCKAKLKTSEALSSMFAFNRHELGAALCEPKATFTYGVL